MMLTWIKKLNHDIKINPIKINYSEDKETARVMAWSGDRVI